MKVLADKGAHTSDSSSALTNKYEKRIKDVTKQIKLRLAFWPCLLEQGRLDKLKKASSKISKPTSVSLANGIKLTLDAKSDATLGEVEASERDSMPSFVSGFLNCLKIMEALPAVYTAAMIRDRTSFLQTAMTGLGGALMKDSTKLELLEQFILKHAHRTLWMPLIPDSDMFFQAVLKDSNGRGGGGAATPSPDKPTGGSASRESRQERKKRLQKDKGDHPKRTVTPGPPKSSTPNAPAAAGPKAKAKCHSRTVAGKTCWLEEQGLAEKCRYDHGCGNCGENHTFDSCSKPKKK